MEVKFLAKRKPWSACANQNLDIGRERHIGNKRSYLIPSESRPVESLRLGYMVILIWLKFVRLMGKSCLPHILDTPFLSICCLWAIWWTNLIKWIW